jgi:hypothetical protein
MQPEHRTKALRHALQGIACTVLMVVAMAPAIAQDTPEMLAAMQAHLPPVPEQVPARDALPAALRAEIPAFRLEVHRWHEDPALRFVMIHGRRIEEDAVVDRDLWLRRIQPDGIVLQFREAFFFQPR